MPKFKEDVRFHEELRQCVLSAYNEKNFPIPKSYQVVEQVSDDSTGYYGLVLSKDDKIVIVSKGTDIPEEIKNFFKTGSFNSFKDLNEDFKMSNQLIPNQVKNVRGLYNKYKGKGEIILTGDSLGGSCSVIVGSQTGTRTVVFNPYGIEDILHNYNLKYDDSNIVNYSNKLDGIITMNSHNHIGDIYEMKSKERIFPLLDHFLEKQQPITEQSPITPEELKRKEGVEAVQNQLRSGVQTISKMQHDINTSDRDIYNKLFKSYLDLYDSQDKTSKFQNKTFGGYRLNNGNGEIYVKEYTRKDGTVVRAHWRSYSGEFDPNKRLSEMNEPELSKAISFWMDEDKFI